ncbi:MAG: alpha/beta hydrolase, partial [Clostridiales bacterium]|nr:alpha/beta hydrolase [Clostridiales bacterium]
EDAVSAYEWLLENHWSEDRIVLAGDSAGGGLAMALCMYLKDRKRPLPAGIVAMSPWTDLSLSGESYHTNYRLDPVFGNTMDSLIFNKEYVREEDTANPYISPLYGNFSDFPPMLIQVGSYEMLLSDSELVAEKAKEAGVKVRLSVYEGMFHVFQMSLLMIPESRTAWREVGKFLDVIQEYHEEHRHFDLDA